MNLNLHCINGKWSIDPTFDHAALREAAPLIASVAEHDIGTTDCTYKIIDGCLYAHQTRGLKEPNWWTFIHSIRKWEECDSPETKSGV